MLQVGLFEGGVVGAGAGVVPAAVGPVVVLGHRVLGAAVAVGADVVCSGAWSGFVLPHPRSVSE